MGGDDTTSWQFCAGRSEMGSEGDVGSRRLRGYPGVAAKHRKHRSNWRTTLTTCSTTSSARQTVIGGSCGSRVQIPPRDASFGTRILRRMRALTTCRTTLLKVPLGAPKAEPHPYVFAQRVCKPLKRKKMTQLDCRGVRKSIERKDLGEIGGGTRLWAVPEGVWATAAS